MSPVLQRAAIIAFRKAHPSWGPAKIGYCLRAERRDWKCPADSTIANILAEAGLVKPRKRRRRVAATDPLGHATAANSVWSADFKGQFRTLDRYYCYPLTVTDNYSRYILACSGFRCIETDGSRRIFERLFREYGLPERLRTDNGIPFATTSIGGLSRLSVWFIRLGIIPERIELGCPQQNGRHERMHRSLKAAVTHPVSGNLRAQNAQMERFRIEFNTVRPHQALNMKTPATLYQPASRTFPEHLPELVYPNDYLIRRVRTDGAIKVARRLVFLGEALAGQDIGLMECDDGAWEVFFGPYALGRLVDGKVARYPMISRRRE